VTHERVRPGFAPQIARYQAVPFSMAVANDKILNNECAAIAVGEQDATYRLFFGAAAAAAIFKCPLLDDRDAIVGFVGVSFVNSLPERPEEVFGKIRAAAWRITGALTKARE
jgi:hypothetical protein